jgi:uncharacterized protein YkwD
VSCRTQKLSHNGFMGRCQAAGYNRTCGENLAWNMNTSSDAPQRTMTQWRNSPGHYKNLISPSTTVVGYGYAKCANGRVYWTGLYSA